ncbi:hypothetical protein CRG98_017777 [Punica granatum]|uniref:Retrotransposon gag domain-containing protein n=1 Tax=Punica granatum TaxID=22663 RepID=A0A2I0JZY6_PUNGR|nr:hypothetical protein CRG98_017777 [Punica granatum]
MGLALDWFMTLKAEDIPTWATLSQKFLDQYRFCAESPPTLLDLSMMEMMENQAFEAYAAKWRGKAAKYIPPITERQQVQLFHSTLRVAYYSHLVAHTSSFSDPIEAGKKHDVGIKLGRIRGPTKKKEEEAPKKHTAAPVQNKAPTSRLPQPTQRTPASQAQQGNAAPSCQRKKFTSLPASLSHIYRQLIAGNRIRSEAPYPNFDPTLQNQDIHCEFHQGAPGHTTDNCWRLREKIQDMIDAKQISFNEIRPSNVQANPLPDHGSSSGPTVNMIGAYFLGED